MYKHQCSHSESHVGIAIFLWVFLWFWVFFFLSGGVCHTALCVTISLREQAKTKERGEWIGLPHAFGEQHSFKMTG